MKKINHILLTAMVLGLAMSGCKQDPFHGVESNERAIESIKITDGDVTQVGPAQIVRDSSKAYIVILNTDAEKPDLTKVKLSIVPSYKARVDGSADEEINFAASNGKITRTVTSESGQQRTWEIVLKDYVPDIGGSWSISAAKYYYDVSKLYGSNDWKNTKSFTDPFSGFGAELDNTYTFTLEGIGEDGNPFGTFTNNAGGDGKYGDYVWHGNTVTDFAYKFKKIPVTGTWVRDLVANTIIFNKGESNESESLPVEWSDDKQSFTISFNPGPNDVVWDNDWGRMELQATDKFWFTLTK
jgi:hypothetical protein